MNKETLSTTGTSIASYLDWIVNELERKKYGEVSITFVLNRGKVVDVIKQSVDKDHYPL